MKRRQQDSEAAGLIQTAIDDALHLSRRAFLSGTGAALTAGGVIAGLTPALADGLVPDLAQQQFTRQQTRLLVALTEHLFPRGVDSPGATEINAVAYIRFTIFRPGISPGLRSFFIKRLATLHEVSMERFELAFEQLEFSQREAVLKTLSEHTRWGENWLALVLSYILEALLADPVYGGNPDGIGWRWLQHQPGFPRPPKNKLYTHLKALG